MVARTIKTMKRHEELYCPRTKAMFANVRLTPMFRLLVKPYVTVKRNIYKVQENKSRLNQVPK
jgi:hypothetical protein